MSTRSRIGIKRKDGSVESIYCHWDGYLEYNGKVLLENYKDINKINELLDLGNISSLGSTIDSTNAYMRDRGETGQEKKAHKDLAEFNAYMYDTWEEFVYLYDEQNEEWKYSIIPYPFTSGSLLFEKLTKKAINYYKD